MTSDGSSGEADEGLAGPGGVKLEKYVLLELLSDSRRGAIYKAKHRLMGRTVAIKFLSDEAARSRQFTERFRRATKILALLEHPNLVRAHEAGEQGDAHYLVMEYLDGQDLNRLLKAEGELPVARAIDYVLQAAAGLAYAHEQGVTHRNIKPSKLVLDSQGVVKIVGFGLAHVDKEGAIGDGEDAESLTIQGQVLGSYEYMAPEQAANAKKADERSDIYSLGCTLHALLTGRPPYEGKGPTMQIVAHSSKPIPSLRESRADVPEALDRVFAKMLAKKPEERFAAMSDVIRELKPFLAAATLRMPAPPAPVQRSQGTPTTPPAPAASMASGGSSRNKLLVGIAGGAAVAVALFLVIVNAFPGGTPERNKPQGENRPPKPKPVEIAKVTPPVAPPVRAKPESSPSRPKGPQTLENLLSPTPPSEPKAPSVKQPVSTPPSPQRPPVESTLAIAPPTPPSKVPEPSTPPKEPSPQPPASEPREPSGTGMSRRSVPNEEARKRATQLMRDTFEADWAAATTPEAKAQLGKRLLDTAAEITDDPAGRYVVLESAMGLAADAGEWPIGLEAIDSMASFFAVDAWGKKVEWLASCAEAAKHPEQRRSAAAQAFELAKKADESAQFEIAARLCTLAATEGKKAAPFPLMKQVRALDSKVNERLAAFKAYESALQQLSKQNSDPQANLEAGRYECFVINKWNVGLPKLAASGESTLQALAAKELATKNDPEQQVAVADGWRELAEKESGLAAVHLHRHAADWYEKAVGNATGLLKTKAERRLEESRANAEAAVARSGER